MANQLEGSSVVSAAKKSAALSQSRVESAARIGEHLLDQIFRTGKVGSGSIGWLTESVEREHIRQPVLRFNGPRIE